MEIVAEVLPLWVGWGLGSFKDFKNWLHTVSASVTRFPLFLGTIPPPKLPPPLMSWRHFPKNVFRVPRMQLSSHCMAVQHPLKCTTTHYCMQHILSRSKLELGCFFNCVVWFDRTIMKKSTQCAQTTVAGMQAECAASCQSHFPLMAAISVTSTVKIHRTR